MIFETLSIKHVDLLFQFELQNKLWFESLISPREDSFFTRQGVKNHILGSVSDMKAGTHYSAVLIADEQIVARANLKDIDLNRGRAFVGYRVADNNTGKGYASYCLGELIRIADSVYSISELVALVLDNNPASKAVLKKHSFNPESYKNNFIELNGTKLGCTTFRYASAKESAKQT